MAHERSITIKQDGKFINIDTSRGAKKKPRTTREAVKHANETGQMGKPFNSIKDAVGAAKKRSKAAENPMVHSMQSLKFPKSKKKTTKKKK